MNRKIKLIVIILFSQTIVCSQTATNQLFGIMDEGKVSVEQLKNYINKGADVNAYSKDRSKWYFGFTPVHVAAANQRADWLKFLVSKGADINKLTQKEAYNNSNASALHVAAYYYYDGSTEALDYLLSKGLDINAYCGNGYTILQSCLISKYTKIDIIKYLLEHGVEINKRHKLGKSGCLFWTFANIKRYDVAQYLISKGATTDMKDWYFNRNLLTFAFFDGKSKFAKLFIDKGLFDVFGKKEIGTYKQYPIHSYFEAAVYYKDYSSVKYMLDKGVSKGQALKIANDNQDNTMINLLETGKFSDNFKKWLDITESETYKSIDFRNSNKKLDFTATDINGKIVNSSDFKGKVVLMNYWATWCGYCLKEMPSMQKLFNTIGKDKLVILAITTEDKNTNTAIKNFANSKGYDFIFIHDPDKKIEENYGVGSLPGTRLFDTNGFSVATIDGSRVWSKDMYVNLINTLYQLNSTSKSKKKVNPSPQPHSDRNKDWEGNWTSNWGSSTIVNIHFSENNGKVSGTYNFRNGRIDANVIKMAGLTLLKGTWTQSNDKGWIEFRLSDDKQSFTGKWGYANGKSGGIWNGTKN